MEREAIEAIAKFKTSNTTKAAPSADQDPEYNPKNGSLFELCMTSSQLPPEEKTLARLTQEAFTIVSTGGETVARTMALACYYVLTNKERVLPRLQAELKTAMPDPNVLLDWKTAEKLTWLVRPCLPLPPAATNTQSRPPSSRRRCG
jgi:cytochrome P450